MKLFQRILAILVLPLLLIGGTNYYFDPDYSLRNNYIGSLTEALLEGKMISGPVNVNSRLLKSQWINKLNRSPEILVLGSSHTLSVGGNIFPGKSFFNASVTNCTFQDMYAFLNLFDKKAGRVPHTLLLCTDQWLFGHSFVENQWLVNRADAVEMAQKVGLSSLTKFPPLWNLQKEWIKELFSVRYFIRSLKARGKTEQFEICQSIINDKMMFLPDGSRSIPEKVLNAPGREVAEKAEQYFYSEKDEHFSDLDVDQCEIFEKMIKCMESNNCRIILYIPPYHPATFRLLEQSGKSNGIFKAESYIRAFAREHNLKVIGNTNPDSLKLNSTDFYDAVHLKPAVLNSLIECSLKDEF